MVRIRLKNFFCILLSFAAAPIFFFRIAQRKKIAKNSLNIFVIPQLTRIGDLVCSTPVYRAIKEKYPAARLSVLISKKTFGMIAHNPRIDEIIVVEEYSFSGLVRKIRKSRFDWSFSLVGTSTSTLLALFGLIPERVKTVRRNRPPSELLTDWMSNRHVLYEDHTYIPGHYLNMLKYLGIESPKEMQEVFPTLEGDRKAKELLGTAKGAPNVFIGVSVTAGNKIKEWGDERFIELARSIHERYDATLVFVGAPADYQRIEKVIAAIGMGTNVAATTFSVEELPSLMRRFSLFIAADTGPIYIAHALGVPLIDIIGPVDPNEQPPHDEKSIHILPAPGIAPSSFVSKSPGTIEDRRRAVESISVPEVLKAVALLQTKCGLMQKKGIAI